MIIYNSRVPLKIQIQNDVKELENYKVSYNNQILEYTQSLEYIYSIIEKQQCEQIINTLLKNSKEKIKVYNTQISKIERNIEIINELLNKLDSLEKSEILKYINKYNKKYSEIKRNVTLNNFDFKSSSVLKYIQTETKDTEENNIIKEEIKSMDENKVDNIENVEKNTEKSKIENNDTLLISEILNSVVLPYTGEEVEKILESNTNNYQTPEEVIAKEFTLPLSNYKIQFWARYNETIQLVTKRAGYRLTDAIPLALEMMRKRYLHPAIITACRNLDELDVYLDCLDKNELEDFKIFNIKYELHPILVKQKKTNNKVSKLFLAQKHENKFN